MSERTCPYCGISQPDDAEHFRPKRRKCRACLRAYTAAWQKANPEKEKARQAAWRAANPDKEKTRHAAYRAANPEKLRASNAA